MSKNDNFPKGAEHQYKHPVSIFFLKNRQGIRMSFRTVNGEGVYAEVRRDVNGRVSIIGKITKTAGFRQSIRWIAPNAPHRGFSFSGSGLPYANADQAFDNTNNKGVIESPDGSFQIYLEKMPGAYYTGLGSTYVPPIVMIEAVLSNNENQTFRTHLFLTPVGVPYRWIAGSPPGPRVDHGEDETGRAMYYYGREELGLFQNQEALLRFKGYPSYQAAEQLMDNVDYRPWLSAPAPA